MNKQGQTILLAIGGGISAYKSAFICSRLVQDGCDVRVAMTGAATKFIGQSATLAALSGKPVVIESFDSTANIRSGAHIELADQIGFDGRRPDHGKPACPSSPEGVADDLVSTLYLQVACPSIARHRR